MEKLRCLRKKLSYPCRIPYIHLYAHLMPTPQCSRSPTDTSCNFSHKLTACNIATGFIRDTVTFLKHFKFGRAAATTSPAPYIGHGKRTMVIVCSASNKLMRYRREQRSELTKECHMARIADANSLFVLISRINQPTHETDCKTVVYDSHLSPPFNHLQCWKYLNALAKNSFALRV